MRIKQLQLHPFAGIPSRIVEFQPGLNVVVGPNEAGKSTLVNALRWVLFRPVRLKTKRLKEELRLFLPVSGGDTIRVSLVFEQDGEYRIHKSWGGESSAELRLPDGNILTNESAVQERLQQLVGHHEATYSNVLMVQQNRLTETVEFLKKEPQPQNDLNSILRQAVFETGGVSLEKLEKAIEQRFHQLLSNWDATLNLPRDNRGIQHPWKREVGEILQAYYQQESLRQRLQEVRKFEEERDQINARLNIQEKEVQTVRDFVEKNRERVQQLQQRLLLAERLQHLEERERRLKNIFQEWPETRARSSELEIQKQEIRTRLRKLQEEQRQAQQWESLQQKMQRWREVKKAQSQLQKLQKEFETLPAVTEKALQELRRTGNQKEKLRATIEAIRLNLTLKSRKTQTIEVQLGLEETRKITLTPETPLKLEAPGRVRVYHEGVEISVSSGEFDVEELERRLQSLQEEETKRLQKMGVQNVEEGEEILRRNNELQYQISSIQKQIKGLLGEDSLEELAKIESAVQSGKPGRTSNEILQELTAVKTQEAKLLVRLEAEQKKLQDWQQQFGDTDTVLDELVKLRQECQEVEKELKSLAQSEVAGKSPEEFIREFEQKEEWLRLKERELHQLRIQKAELDAREPDESSEILRSQLEEAERQFQYKMRQGQAIARIREHFRRLKEEMDKDTLSPWQKAFRTYLVPLTAHRYREVRLENNLPERIVRHDGLELALSQLSVGTRDALALALRLSMAHYFLRQHPGFLILDDPLVDMDPERQMAAVELLQQFARQHQLILLTCHPDHAEQLGGHLIEMR